MNKEEKCEKAHSNKCNRKEESGEAFEHFHLGWCESVFAWMIVRVSPVMDRGPFKGVPCISGDEL